MAIENSTLLPINQQYDPEEIISLDVQSEEFKEFLVQLYLTQQDLLQSANYKTSGIYDFPEALSGNVYPSGATSLTTKRSGILKLIQFPPATTLPNAGTIEALHGIDFSNITTFVRIYGVATNLTAPRTAIPIPYISSTGNIVEVIVLSDRIRINTNANFTAYTNVRVVVEYIKGL